jgi:hypothetical protein
VSPGVHPASYPMGIGGSFPGRKADYSPTTSADFKKTWVYTSTPLYVFMAWCLINEAQGQFYFYYLQWTAELFPWIFRLMSTAQTLDNFQARKWRAWFGTSHWFLSLSYVRSSKVAQAWTLTTCIWHVLISNLDWDTVLSEVSLVFSVPPEEFRNYTTKAPSTLFWIHDSIIIVQFDAI